MPSIGVGASHAAAAALLLAFVAALLLVAAAALLLAAAAALLLAAAAARSLWPEVRLLSGPTPKGCTSPSSTPQAPTGGHSRARRARSRACPRSPLT